MRHGAIWLAAALLAASLLGRGAPVAALSGFEMPSAEQVLADAEVIVIARAGEALGVIDQPGGGIYTLYELQAESYIRPAAPGPERLVLVVSGGMGLTRATNGGQVSPDRALYFLRRDGATYREAFGVATPTMPLVGAGFHPNSSKTYQAGFAPLLEAPRYPAYPAPAVWLHDRLIGRADLVDGRAYLPAEVLAEGLSASLTPLADGALELRRGDLALRLTPADGLLPVRAAAEALGATVRWDQVAWAVELTLPEGPPEVALISEAEAVARLSASFDDYYRVASARLQPNWIDPRTGGERTVWELRLGYLSDEDAIRWLVMVDAVSGEVLLSRLLR